MVVCRPSSDYFKTLGFCILGFDNGAIFPHKLRVGEICEGASAALFTELTDDAILIYDTYSVKPV